MTYPKNLHVIHLNSIDSTNDYIKRNHQELKQYFPMLVHADTQTHGRGRTGRQWDSPAVQGLYVSFAFMLRNRSALGLLPLMTGAAILEVLRPLGQEAMFVKWPNDIMSRHRKLAGILTETIIYGEQLTCISGIGININQAERDFPPPLRQTAISLKNLYSRPFSIEKIKQALAHTFMGWVEKLERGEVELIVDTINHASYHSTGDKIRFHQGERIIEGTFIRIDRDGGLILQEEGKRSSYYSGEIQNI